MFNKKIYLNYPKVVFSMAANLGMNTIPKRFRLPARYGYHTLFGSLDDELRCLKDFGIRGNIAIDVGANVGLWSYKLSKLFSEVESFEPFSECVGELVAYNAQNITIHNVALSSRDGSGYLHLPIIDGRIQHGAASCNDVVENHKTISVPLRTLDSYDLTSVDFIKIDVEGYELEVIKGAQATITREKPFMVIEIEQRHLTFKMSEVFNEIIGLGYEAYFLLRDEWRSYDDFSYELHQKPFLNNLTSKYYVRDFLFKPKF